MKKTEHELILEMILTKQFHLTVTVGIMVSAN